MIAILLLSMTTNLAHATEVITWQQAVKKVEQNNASLEAAVSTLKSLQQKSKANNGAFLPRISVGLNYNQVDQKNTEFESQESNTKNYSSVINGSINLFSGFADLSRKQIAQLNARAYQGTLQKTKATLSYELKSAFEGLLYAKDYKNLAEQIVSRRQENHNMVRLRFESGLENRGSLLLAKAYLEQAKYDLLQANNLDNVVKARLSRLLGFIQEQDFTVAGQVPIQDPPEQKPDFYAIASELHPEMIEADAAEQSAQKAITLARASFLPSLDLTSQFRKSNTEFYPDQQEQLSVGLSLTFPLFDGGRDYYNLKSAVSELQAATSRRKNVNQTLISSLEQGYASYIEAVAKFKVDHSFKQAAELRAEIARKRYNNGLLTFENWDVIENDLINRQKSYLISKRDRVIAEAAWEQVQGKGVIE